MQKHGVKSFVFSSSATVYGAPEPFPAQGLTEDLPTAPTNPYGRTKAFIEQILHDAHIANPAGSLVASSITWATLDRHYDML
jgi:UDP-glucose 4-epimerase